MITAPDLRTAWEQARRAADAAHARGASATELYPLQRAEAVAYAALHQRTTHTHVAPPPTALAINHRVALTPPGPPPTSHRPITERIAKPMPYTNGATETPSTLSVDLTAPESRCRITGCTAKREVRGVCQEHYTRARALNRVDELLLPRFSNLRSTQPADLALPSAAPVVLTVPTPVAAATTEVVEATRPNEAAARILDEAPAPPESVPTAPAPIAAPSAPPEAIPAPVPAPIAAPEAVPTVSTAPLSTLTVAPAPLAPAHWPHLVLPDPAGGPGCVLSGPDLSTLLRGLDTLRGSR